MNGMPPLQIRPQRVNTLERVSEQLDERERVS